MTEDHEQQMARVNITREDWVAFRHLAIQHRRSIADYLGALVRDELQRARRVRAKGTGAAERPQVGGETGRRQVTEEVTSRTDGASTPRSRIPLREAKMLSWRDDNSGAPAPPPWEQ